jgi:hypothetical protein
MPLSENEVMRKQTAEFIAIYPQVLVLTRPVTASDGAGGSTATPTPLAAQTFRQITQSTSPQVFTRTIDGEEVKPDFVLLGEWNVDVQIGDYYTKDGAKHEVVYVKEDRRYETWAEVMYRG